jgi:hypothetical protein
MDHSPSFVAMDLATRLFSPCDVDPLKLNPLREILAASIDFGHLAVSSVRVFVSATNVRTGHPRVFHNAEWGFLTPLRDEGRQAAQTVLNEHGADLVLRASDGISALLDDD